ncbi:MAG: tetratricopeptide repeat protein [Gaiellales bacterium]
MLFERIRRGQKPVFLFLAVMFGLGFVALGVGSGAGGINLGDLLNTGGGSGSVSDLSAKTREHPNNAPAWRELAAAYQADGQTDAAIGAYLRYIALRPKDQNGLSGGASLLELRARQSQTQLTRAEALAAQYTTPSSASAAQALKLAPALSHSVQDALAQPYNTKVQTLQSRISSDYLQATALRQKLVALDPRNAPYQFALAQDAAAGRQYTTAATALKAYLDLEPNLDAATRQQLEQTLKALQSFGTTPAAP